MSVNPFPDCRCAGFNDACYAEIAAGTIINVPTKQLVSTTNFTFDNTTAITQYPRTPFMYNLIFTTPASATSYDFFGFSGGAIIAGLVISGSTTPGSTATITRYGTAASGSGVKALSVPTTASQNAVSLVAQPNFYNPNISTVWTGTATINWTAGTIQLMSVITGATSSIVPNSAFYINSPPSRCPSSLFITTNNGGNNYSFLKGTLDTSYFVNQTTALTMGAYGTNGTKFQGSITITAGIATFSNITSGAMTEGMWVITTANTYLTGASTGTNTFRLIGVPTTVNQSIITCVGVFKYDGVDIQYGTYISNVLTPQAFVRGAYQNRILAGGTGGTITVSASATNTTPMVATNGNAGQTQSTTNYNVGLTNFTIADAVSTNAQNYGGNVAVKTCATSGGVVQTFPLATGPVDIVGFTGFGGMTLSFYK
jgi:hypothetical protein